MRFDAKHHKVEIEQLALSGMLSTDLMALDPELAELMRLEEEERARATPGGGNARLAQLELLAELHPSGALTDAEFAAEPESALSKRT